MTDPYAKPEGWSATPDYDDLERRRRRRESPFVDDSAVGELEPLLGTPEPDNVPAVGQATPEQPQAEGYALQPGEELGVETEAPGTGVPMEEVPELQTRVVVSTMPSAAGGEQLAVSEVYPRIGDAPVLRWVRTLPNPAPFCTDEGREHVLIPVAHAGHLESGGQSWQVTLYVCTVCPHAETNDADEPPTTFRAPTPATLEAAARHAETRGMDPDRAAELRSRKDRGGRAVEREGNES